MNLPDVQKVVAFTLIATMCSLALVWVFWHPDVSGNAKDIALMILGGLISCVTTAVNYIFRRE